MRLRKFTIVLLHAAFTLCQNDPSLAPAETARNVSFRRYPPRIRTTRRMAFVPGGSFIMGAATGRRDERPGHRVWLAPFYMDEFPVTVGEYGEFVRAGGPVPAYHRYSDYNRSGLPVTGVTWYEAACYCNWRSRREGLRPAYRSTGRSDRRGYPIWECDFTADGYRLPTEAEFERAARSGEENRRFPWGDIFDPGLANYDEGRGVNRGRWRRLARVTDQYRNRFGLYGLSGNVFEWTNDWYDADYYQSSPPKNPTGPARGAARVMRGGSWGGFTPEHLRVARRSFCAPGGHLFDLGFRTVRPPPVEFASSERISRLSRSGRARAVRVGCRILIRRRPRCTDFGSPFRRELARYLENFYRESLYFQMRVDEQAVLTPQQLADLITRVALEYKIHPLFLLGVMSAESAVATVSYPRWFNNPMAYNWANWKMGNGPPLYEYRRGRNRRYRTLEEGFRAFCRGIRRPRYVRAARGDLYRFHRIYVGYEALEWMRAVGRGYRDLLGIDLTPVKPASNWGRYIYLDWERLVGSDRSTAKVGEGSR